MSEQQTERETLEQRLTRTRQIAAYWRARMVEGYAKRYPTKDEIDTIHSAAVDALASLRAAPAPADYDRGYVDGLKDSSGDPRVAQIEAGFKAIQEATGGEYTAEDHIVIAALNAGMEFAVRLARMAAPAPEGETPTERVRKLYTYEFEGYFSEFVKLDEVLAAIAPASPEPTPEGRVVMSSGTTVQTATGFQTAPTPDGRETVPMLMKFAGRALESQRPFTGDWDGGDMEERMVECGLLQAVVVSEPCSDACECATGDTCYRHTPLGEACLSALTGGTEETTDGE